MVQLNTGSTVLGSRKLTAFNLATRSFNEAKDRNPCYFVDPCPVILKMKIICLLILGYSSKEIGWKILPHDIHTLRRS